MSKICTTCQSTFGDDATFCSVCGTELTDITPNATSDPQPTQQDPQYEYRVHPEVVVPEAPKSQVSPDTYRKYRTMGILGFIFALVSICFAWIGFIPIVGIIFALFCLGFGIAGLVLANKSKKNIDFGLSKAGKIIGIIGVCISGIMLVISILFSTILIGAINKSHTYSSPYYNTNPGYHVYIDD